MMSWQQWEPPAGWPGCAPRVRWQALNPWADHQVTLWLFELDAPEADAPSLIACLRPEERERADRFKFALHGRRHRVGRAMLRHILGHLHRQAAADVAWPVGPHGKPGPLGASPPLHFNLSHSGGWALLATSFDLELGVDLEDEAATERIADLADRILSPIERVDFDTRRADAAAADALLRTWVRKEACLKALGTGLTMDMSALTLGEHLAHLDPEAASPATLGWRDLRLPASCGMRAALAWHPNPGVGATQA